MKISKSKCLATVIMPVILLLAARGAVADDTELLLVNPDPDSAPAPNVLFILDTSGSMDTVEETIEPYDPSNDYSSYGDCDRDSYYWSDVSIPPSCDGSETRLVNKTAFHCNTAMLQLTGIGSYTNTMVQYRPGALGVVTSWQDLAPGNTEDPVECEADSGRHGDGTPGRVYASALSDLLDPWTNDSSLEISWGSAPRNVSYTIYDGNYLNWKHSPVTTMLSRNEIMRSVTKTVLNSVNHLNVGVMRFNNRDGGTVIQAITDLDSNRQGILDVIDALDADGSTPLSETMYESALYWRGMPAHYGQNINEFATDPAALRSTAPKIYKSPVTESCAKNYNVLLTDGEPTDDMDSQALVPQLPQYNQLLGRSACSNGGQGGCLSDVSEYLSLVDTDAQSLGVQNVITHTIGFTVDLPILRDTAHVSNGEYFLADDIESLTLALLRIVANINDRSLSFSAPALSVNTFNRTQNLNQVYLTVFSAQNKVHWPGNLKRYGINNGTIVDVNNVPAVDPTTGFFVDSAQSYWSATADGNDVRMGGAARQLPNPSLRNLFTNNGNADLTAANNQVTPSNANAFSNADFGLTGADGEPTRDEIIRWARGEDTRDEDNNPATTVRYAMGDPLHSQPAAIVYGGNPSNPEVVVFTATNDGYLHAIDGESGKEIWSYIPKQLLSNLALLYFDPSSRFKNYGIDGNLVPVVRDENRNGLIDGNDFVYLLFGLRRGGNNYYALDVTHKNAPRLLWNVSYSDQGQSWSTPVVSRVNIDSAALNAEKAVVVVGGGYDAVHDTSAHPASADSTGAAVYFLDLKTGAELWRAGRDGSADTQIAGMTRSIPGTVRVLDISGDGFADRMYAADMGGQILRFDIRNGQPPASLITGGVIAQLGAEGLASPGAADTRRFYNSPDVSIISDVLQDRRYLAVSIGSGYRVHPFDVSAADRFYSVRDPDVFRQLTQTEYDNYDIVHDDDLVEVAGNVRVVLDPADRGWRFTMPANQKVLADSVTFNDEIMFVGFSPTGAAAASCAGGQGTNYLYRVSVSNGDPVVNNLDTLDPEDADDARSEMLSQSGIAPTPTILFPSPDDPDCEGGSCAPPPIGCVGVECFNPGFVNNPVRTLWTQDGTQ